MKNYLQKINSQEVWKALRLGNNSISTIRVFESISTHFDHTLIQWLDLSFNHLARVDESLVALFPNLTTLYLHANQITKLSNIKKLAGLTQLKSLTLYGNPLEENKHYRNYILHIFPELQQLDFSVITSGQREKVLLLFLFIYFFILFSSYLIFQMLSWSQVFRKSLNPEESS